MEILECATAGQAPDRCDPPATARLLGGHAFEHNPRCYVLGVTEAGSAGDEPPSRSARRWHQRWVAAAVAAGALVLFIGILLGRSGGPVEADTTEHVKPNAVIGPLTTAPTVEQRFTARADELSSITMRFGTGGGVSRCKVGVRLTSVGTEVASRVIPCAALTPDSAPFEILRFAPQRESNGREYQLDLSLAEAGGQSVGVWAGTEPDGLLPPAQFGDDPLPVSAELHTRYGGDHHAWDQITLALRRLEQYRPWFQSAAVVALTAVAAFAALVLLVVARGRRAVALLIVLVVAKGLLWAAIIPPLEAPDEPAHVAYAQFMAEAHRIPKRDVTQLSLPPELIYSPQLTGLIDALHQESQTTGDRPDFQPGGDPSAVENSAHQSPDANGNGAAAGYAPVFYAPAAVLYKLSPGPLLTRIEVMRWWSIALGALAGWFSLLIGRRVFPRYEGAAIALAVACVLQPELSQQTAVMNNDTLAIAGGAASILVAVELVSPANARARWLCFLGGAALGITMFKSFGVAIAPVLLVAWFIGRARAPQGERPSIPHEIGQTIAGLGITYGAWALFAAVFDFRGASLADLTPSDNPKSLSKYIEILQKDWYRAIRVNWIDQLWGDFSWVDTPFPTWVQSTILVLTLAGIAVVFAWAVVVVGRLVRRRYEETPNGLDAELVETWAHTLICLLFVAVTFVFFLGLGFLNFHRTGRNDLIQGRYALMLTPAILAAPTLALRSLWPRLNPSLPMVMTAGFVTALNIGAIALIVDRFYL